MLTFFRIAGLLALGLVLLTACVPEDVTPAGPPPTPTCTEGSLCEPSFERTPVTGGAIVRELRMREPQRAGDPRILLIEGDLRDGCTTLEAVEQRIDNNRVIVDLITYRQPEAMCSQALVPFTYSIELEDRLWDQAGTGDRLTVEVGEQTLLVIRGEGDTGSRPTPKVAPSVVTPPAAPRTPSPEGGLSGDRIVRPAPVESIEVRAPASGEATVSLTVSGYLPDGCSTLGEVSQRIEGRRILVSISMERPRDAICTQAIVPYTERVTLDLAGLSAGDYVVDVNGVIGDLPLEEGVPAEI